MPEPNHLGINEARITRVVTQAIKDASIDLELTVQRYLARGGKFDAAVLADMHRALLNIAEQYSIDLTGTVWGREIIAAARKGGKSVPGAVFTLSKDQIDVALYNAGTKIKGILEAGVQQVQDIVAAGMIRGDSLRDISQAVQDRVTVEGGVIDAARADMIARNEVFGAYRQVSQAAADEEGIELFQMRGPMDSRTSAICAANIGKVKTKEQWNAIRADALTWGLHYGCRHSFDPVRDAKSPAVQRYRKLAKKQVQAAA